MWRSTTNTCHAVYRHVWGDAWFVSNTSAVPIDILLPRSALLVGEFEGGSRQKDALASQDETVAEAGAELAKASATVTDREVSSRASSIGDSADQRLSQQEASARETQRVTQQAATTRSGVAEDKQIAGQLLSEDVSGQATGSQSHGRQSESAGTSAVALSLKETSLEHANFAGMQQVTAQRTTEAAGEQSASTAERAQAASTGSDSKTAGLAAADYFQQSEAREFVAWTAPAAHPATARNSFAESEGQATAVLPLLVMAKSARPASVMAGGTVTFVIQATNAGELELRDIVVCDAPAAHLSSLGVGRSLAERLFPSLCRVTEGPVGLFHLKGNLKPGETFRFIIRYRTATPDEEDRRETRQDA